MVSITSFHLKQKSNYVKGNKNQIKIFDYVFNFFQNFQINFVGVAFFYFMHWFEKIIHT